MRTYDGLEFETTRDEGGIRVRVTRLKDGITAEVECPPAPGSTLDEFPIELVEHVAQSLVSGESRKTEHCDGAGDTGDGDGVLPNEG